VAAEDDARAVGYQPLDRGEGGANARVVLDRPITQGDIEVHAAEDALAAHIEIAD
jgi:hypothetical protein